MLPTLSTLLTDEDPIIRLLGFSTAGAVNGDGVSLTTICMLAAIRAHDSFVKILYPILAKYPSWQVHPSIRPCCDPVSNEFNPRLTKSTLIWT